MISFIIEREKETCHDVQKLKEFMVIKPALQRYLRKFYTMKRKIKETRKILESIKSY
jgi:hypothetical protein